MISVSGLPFHCDAGKLYRMNLLGSITVHAVQTIRDAGYEAIIINNNPETVSTDYTCSDKLYFEPLCTEDVMNILVMEKPEGVIATLGGQTAINLADPLRERGVKIIGTDGDETITADDVAGICGTIGYEIVCGISKRVPRIFLEDGRMVHEDRLF